MPAGLLMHARHPPRSRLEPRWPAERRLVMLPRKRRLTKSSRGGVRPASLRSAREKARKAAMDAGVMAVNKEVADGLRAADTARANFQALWAQLEPYLAKDAGGRLVQGPINKLEKLFQSIPTLGAFGSWRTA